MIKRSSFDRSAHWILVGVYLAICVAFFSAFERQVGVETFHGFFD